MKRKSYRSDFLEKKAFLGYNVLQKRLDGSLIVAPKKG